MGQYSMLARVAQAEAAAPSLLAALEGLLAIGWNARPKNPDCCDACRARAAAWAAVEAASPSSDALRGGR